MQHLFWLSVAVPLAALAVTATGCSRSPTVPTGATTSSIESLESLATASAPTASITVPPGPRQTATGANGSGRDDRIGPPASGRPSKGELAVGDCFNETFSTTDPPVRELTVVGCRVPHDGEVYVVDSLEGPRGASFPGDREVERTALRICLPAFGGFIGQSYGTSALRVSMLRPVSSSWPGGDRGVVCSVYDPDLVPLVGTMSGSKR